MTEARAEAADRTGDRRRSASSFAVLAPTLVGTGTWIDPILTPTLIFGLAAASLIFLSAYGGMISLTQTALMGIAGYAIGNMVSQGGAGGESKGLALGWDPTVSVLVLAIVITVVVAFVFGAIASRSYGIYFLMLTLTFGGDREPLLRLRDEARRASRRSRASTGTRRPGWATSSTIASGSTTSRSAVALVGYVLIRYSRARHSASRFRASGTSRCAWPRSATRCRSIACSRSPSPDCSRESRACSRPGGTARSRPPTSGSTRRSRCS